MQKSRGSSSGSANGSHASSSRSARKTAATGEEEARQKLAASTKIYYRIGEVSELTGVKAHVLRYWETEFRWMAPPKSRSKQRLYRKRDIEFVWLLKKLLWEQRFTIAGARQRIQELGLEEALARGGDFETTEAFLAAAGLTASGIPVTGAAPMESAQTCVAFAGGGFAGAGGEEPGSAGDGSRASSAPPGADWLGLRIALDGMQAELLALRGVLQQGS